MKSTYLILALAISLLIFGCSETDTPPTPPVTGTEQPEKPEEPKKEDPEVPERPPVGNTTYSYTAPHYLLMFFQPKEFWAQATSDSTITIRIEELDFYYSWWYTSFPEKAEQTAIYESICERYDDLAYNKERKYVDIYPGGYDYLADNIVSINVISGTDYDQAHPAGSSLNDLCILASASPREHIASGYTKTYDWETNPENFDPSFQWIFRTESASSIPFAKPLAECTPEDMVLMGSGRTVLCLLRFISRPTTGQKQRFIITLTDEKGMTYTAATNECEW